MKGLLSGNHVGFIVTSGGPITPEVARDLAALLTDALHEDEPDRAVEILKRARALVRSKLS